jgi:3-oxoadipate enol-lactonase
LQIERARLLGWSFGGLIALDFALAYPDRVSALVLGAPSVSGTEPSQRIKAFWAAEEKAFDEGDLEAATELNLRLWVDGPEREAGEVDAGVRALVGVMQQEIFEMEIPDDIEERELEPPAAGRLAEIRVPTLVVVGSLDLEEKVAQSKEIAGQVVDGRCVRIDGAAHMVNMEKSEEFNRIVSDFFRVE